MSKALIKVSFCDIHTGEPYLKGSEQEFSKARIDEITTSHPDYIEVLKEKPKAKPKTKTTK